MFGKRNQKEEVVRIDVDWLLGESTQQSERGVSWFKRISIFLVCVLAVVWCWPYASRHWLDLEWHRQLAKAIGSNTEDVLPYMLAIQELNPKNNMEMVEHLGSSDANKRSIAYRLLEQRIQQLRNTAPIPPSEISSLIETMNSNRIQSPESLLLRAQLAAQLKPLVASNLPNATTLIASIDVMVAQGESRSNSQRPNMSTVSTRVRPNENKQPTLVSQANDRATRINFRLEENAQANQGPIRTQVIETSAQTAAISHSNAYSLTDQASTMGRAALPNLSLSIPRTASKAQVVHSSAISTQPTDAVMSASETSVQQQEPSSIKGIEKLELENLLSLLNSSQTRIERQAFNELVRRNIPKEKLEIAMILAHGENEEKFRAMEIIARDPQSAIPWLVWMAGNSEPNTDQKVRRRAIALLGSMTDPDAMHRLRDLQKKESDGAISDQINQVLLASGIANRVVR